MGFEQKVPPVPNRQQQLKGMQRLQTNWLNQPYYKYYMNEAVRQSKMSYADRLNKCRSDFLFNLTFYGIILLPVAFMTRKFFVSRGGIPITNYPNYFDKVKTDKEAKIKMFNKFSIASYLLVSNFLAYVSTNWEPIFDINYEYVAKPVKYL